MATSLVAGSVLAGRFVPFVVRPGACGALILACSLVGCSNNAWQGVDITGTVQAGGVVIPRGSISFLPASGRSGPAATAVITDGRFHIAGADGPLPGPHQVLVYLECDPKSAILAGGAAPKAPPKTRWETQVEIPAAEHFACDLKLD